MHDPASNAMQHELQIAADLAAQPAWFGGGRFGGRIGKMARIRQQEALAAAKLGHGATSTVAPAVSSITALKKRKRKPIPTETACPASATGSVVKRLESSKKHKGQPGLIHTQPAAACANTDAATNAPLSAKTRIVLEPAYESTAPSVPFVATPATGWWGAKKFKSAGCLEGLHQQQTKVQPDRQEFDEDDQTKLYMAAQNLKTSGKRGLGTKSHIGQLISS